MTKHERASTNGQGAPLHGVIVLDLTRFLAGPYCTQILADLGARVIKVEAPGGDNNRTMPPHFVGGTSAHFLNINRSKESIVIDLKDPAGKDLALRLAARADIVVENYRPGVLQRLGLGFDQLKSVNPRIVLCSISGFGQDGPYRQRPAFDVVIQAMSGVMSVTGETGRPPVAAGTAVADLSAGMFGVIGALAALRQAQETGEARHVDIAMMDGQVSMLAYHAAYYLAAGVVPGPRNQGHPTDPVTGAFMCADGLRVQVAPMTNKLWALLCEALGRSDLTTRPEFATQAARIENREPLLREMNSAFLAHRSADLLDRLTALGVPSGPINTIDRVCADPHVRHRKMLVDLEFGGQPISVIGSAVKISDVETEYRSPPQLGEHTEALLRELAEVEKMKIDRLADRAIAPAS